MLWFLRGLRRGIVTTRYPAGEPDAWSASLPTPPAFHAAALTPALAARLEEICPSRALTLAAGGPDRPGRPGAPGELVLDLGRCSCCGRCLEAGGDAVVASGEFLLATRERSELIKRIPIGGGR